MSITIDASAGWIGGLGDNARTDRVQPLKSPQYGPAWVANCMGTTHKKRVKALRKSGIDPELLDHLVTSNDRDGVARHYARIGGKR